MTPRDLTSLIQNPTADDRALVERAYAFAERAHAGHIRNSGEPYMTHLFETARTLAELGMSATVIAAGLLHDSVEDVGVTPEQIEREFGGEIRFIVEGVTKLGNIKYKGTSRYNESLRKLFVAMSQDIRVLIVKLADRLHNVKTLQHVPQEKQLRIAKETLEIYAPIANRLGIKTLQRELEDTTFPYVYPADYARLKKLFTLKRSEQEEHLDKFQRSLKKELAKNGITHFHMDQRVKSLYSLYKKMLKNNWGIETIYDISAIRIIVYTTQDCYRILGIIHGAWRPLPGRIKDYIASPKLSGYQSLHTTVFTGDGGIVEVQIRTEDMHREAEYGIASHMTYKEGSRAKTNANLTWIKRILPSAPITSATAVTAQTTATTPHGSLHSDVPQWIKELVDYEREAGDEFVDEIKHDFLEERIFVFTPIGDVIDLPAHSSIIDFAYAIHSDVGNHMSGAKVNGKLVAITTELESGDRIEIITKKSARPNRKWIEHCRTTMARRHIRSALEK